MQPVFRFAPSPNGLLHLGHAYSALLNARFARRHGGRLLLRLEDIDVTRCRPSYEAAMLDDLAWLGLAWEQPVRRQSEHFAEYASAADTLRARHLLYACRCTRGGIAAAVAEAEQRSGRPWPRDPDGAPLYPGTCRGAPPFDPGLPVAWRLDMAAALAAAPGPHPIACFDPLTGEVARVAAQPERWGDLVLVRKEVPASYPLAVVHDDALQGVTHVVRGEDLRAATDLHVLLQALLGLPRPLYHHHRLITDPHGRKLAKSLSSEPLRDLKARGATPAAIRERLGLPQIRPST